MRQVAELQAVVQCGRLNLRVSAGGTMAQYTTHKRTMMDLVRVAIAMVGS